MYLSQNHLSCYQDRFQQATSADKQIYNVGKLMHDCLEALGKTL